MPPMERCETMPEIFDPYYIWLGIPKEESLRHYYLLLGLKPLESDLDVISHACDRRMAYLKNFTTGPNHDDANQLLNEIATARIHLLDSEQKAAYDENLRAALSASDKLPDADAENEKKERAAVWGDYKLLEKTSSGKFSRVYKAKHRHMDRKVLLKLLKPESAHNKEIVERFRREVQITGRLSHPNVVSAYDSGEAEGTYFLVMEYLEGPNLSALLKQQGPLPVDRALDYICQAARGLQYLHDNNVYHRNVKPRNLMLGENNTVKVLNLLLARLDDIEGFPESTAHFDITVSGEMIGTPDYISPEQTNNAHAIDHRADIYSLGCTLYVLLAGKTPYPFKSAMEKLKAHSQSPIPSLCETRSDVPESVDRVFQKMVAKDPADRYHSMNDVIHDLTSWRKTKSVHKTLLIVAGAVVALILVALLVWIFKST